MAKIMMYVISHSSSSLFSRVLRSMTLPMCCSSQCCSTMPKAKSDSSWPASSGGSCGIGLRSFDLAQPAVIHPDQMKAALIVGDEKSRQVADPLPEDFQQGGSGAER